MDDFDHAFGDCWWKNDGISPAHQKWSNWYFADSLQARPSPFDYADHAWQNQFEEIKTAIYLAVREQARRSGVTR